MNIGIGGALFMWLLMLWPLIVGLVYPLVRKPQVSNVPALSVLSIVVGYALVAGFFKLAEAAASVVGDLGHLSVALLLVVPPLATHLIFTSVARSNGPE